MTTPEIFRSQLYAEFKNAEEKKQPYVDINSGNLHRTVGGYPGNNHRMPVCCEVMYAEMRTGDQTLASPPKGKGASLTIRFNLPR